MEPSLAQQSLECRSYGSSSAQALPYLLEMWVQRVLRITAPNADQPHSDVQYAHREIFVDYDGRYSDAAGSHSIRNVFQRSLD